MSIFLLEYLMKPLEDFVARLPVNVKILRNPGRLGLIRSRIVGAGAAIGETMTFLDAHIEATEGWLEPLLTEVNYNRYSKTRNFKIE
jgi:polypeptide N-acetylgalactosaminyltransferase